MPARNNVPLYYWDANVFLSLIEGRSDRVPDITQLLERADERRIEIHTSTVTIVEVAYHQDEKARKSLSADVEERVKALWLPPSPVSLVEFHVGIADEARQLMRNGLESGWSLKPLDAIHLATAKLLGITTVHTYDEKLLRYGPLIGAKITSPLVNDPKFPFA